MKALTDELKQLRSKLASGRATELAAGAEGGKVVARVDGLAPGDLRDLAIAVRQVQGVELVDEYAWLRAENWQEVLRKPDVLKPDIRAYLESENAYHEAAMADTAAEQGKLFAEMKGRIKEDDSRPPVKRDDWHYYSRTEKGKAYPIYCRKYRSLDAPEQVFFDQNAAAAGHEYYQLGGMEVSPDHRYVALLVDTSGYEEFTLRVLEVATGTWLPDALDTLGFGLAWASDSRTVFYLTTDAAKRANEVWRHALGTPREADARPGTPAPAAAAADQPMPQRR